MAGQALISGQMTGTPLGTVNIGPFTLVANAAGNIQVTSVTLSNGNNTIAVPSWAKGMIIEPNPINAISMVLKGVNTDTGFLISSTTPSCISFQASVPANFVLNASAPFVTITTITFF